MPRVIVCDVNETLLDVGALEPHFRDIFGDGRILQDWFTNVLLYSEVATLAGPYADFSSIGAAVLDMLASARGITLSAADRDRILQGMLTLPAHPDVRDGLQTMRDAGLRLVTLSNSAPAALEQQLSSAGLTAFFEHSFSVDAVRRFKPAAEVYRLGRRLAGAARGSTAPCRGACLGCRWRLARRLRGGLRRATWEGALSARSAAGHHRNGFSERRRADRRRRNTRVGDLTTSSSPRCSRLRGCTSHAKAWPRRQLRQGNISRGSGDTDHVSDFSR